MTYPRFVFFMLLLLPLGLWAQTDSVVQARVPKLADSVGRVQNVANSDSLKRVSDSLAVMYIKYPDPNRKNRFIDSLMQLYQVKNLDFIAWAKQFGRPINHDGEGKLRKHGHPWVLVVILCLVLGFAVQRFLADVVAGFFILFEGQFAVGDLVVLESTVPMGIVERATLRVTVMRAMNGDVIYMPNSLAKGVQRFAHHARAMEVGVLVTDVAPVARAVADAADLVGPGGVRFMTAPMVTRTDDMGDGLHWVRVRVDVPPGFEWMASGLLVDVIRARCGDTLRGEPIVADSDEAVLQGYARMLSDAESAGS